MLVHSKAPFYSLCLSSGIASVTFGCIVIPQVLLRWIALSYWQQWSTEAALKESTNNVSLFRFRHKPNRVMTVVFMAGNNSPLFWILLLLLLLLLLPLYLAELMKSVRHRVFFRTKCASTYPVPVLWSLEQFSWLFCLLAGALAPELSNRSASQMAEEYGGGYGYESPNVVVLLIILDGLWEMWVLAPFPKPVGLQVLSRQVKKYNWCVFPLEGRMLLWAGLCWW